MSIFSWLKSLFKYKAGTGDGEHSPGHRDTLERSNSSPKQGQCGKGRAGGSGTVVRKQPARLKDHEKNHEIAGQGTGTVVRESSAKLTGKKPDRAKEATPSQHVSALNDPGAAIQPGWEPGEVWPKGKKLMGIYQIEGILGEGGMGLVYKAMDLATNRPVAIKSLKPCYAQDAEIKALFRREAESWVKVGVHPNIIRAYDVHEIEYLPRIIAEYADAGSLDTHLGHGLLPMDRALDIAIQICWGMAYAHDNAPGRNLVHRDLKPANIFLTQNGTVKVADFGLAKMIEVREGKQGGRDLKGSADGLTIGGAGTVEYMSPEQWQGRAGKEADIYSFGVLMYELFCGRRPFDFSHAHPDARALFYKDAHENQNPPRPEEFRQDIPSSLAEIMFQCLEKEPSARPKDFRAIAKVLDEVSQEHFNKALTKEPDELELDRQTKLDQAWALVRLGINSNFQGDPATAMRLWEDALKTFQALGNQDGVSSYYCNMGLILTHRGEYDNALHMFMKGLKIMETLSNQSGIGKCYLNMGNIFHARGEYDRALQMFEKSLTIKETLNDQSSISVCYNNMGEVFRARCEYDRAMQMYEKSLRIAETLSDQSGIGNCYTNKGNIFHARGEYDRALHMYEKSLRIAETISDQAGMSYLYNNMGEVFRHRGEYDNALHMFKKSLMIKETLSDHSGIGKCYLNMGNIFAARGEYEMALQMFEKSLMIKETLNDQSGISVCYTNMGNIFHARGEYERALQMFEKSLKIAEALGNRAVISASYTNMGITLGARGEYDKALQMHEKSLMIDKALGDQSGIGKCYLNMGNIFYARGEYDRALQMQEKSLAIMRRIGDPNQNILAQHIAKLKQKLDK